MGEGGGPGTLHLQACPAQSNTGIQAPGRVSAASRSPSVQPRQPHLHKLGQLAAGQVQRARHAPPHHRVQRARGGLLRVGEPGGGRNGYSS